MKKLTITFMLYVSVAQTATPKPTSHYDNKTDITVTIWVHGSLVGPNFLFHDFFFRKIGMVRALDYHPRYHSRDMALSLCTSSPDTYHIEHFYFWGWSGKLSTQARAKEAHILYKDLKSLIQNYKKEYPNKTVRLRLISHSHGGNLLLNLSNIKDDDDPLVYDELIVLSCPVQHATKEYVKSNRFRKIYAFYSSDLFQVIDFQRIKKNARIFKTHSGRRFQELPNVRQAKVKINGWALLHVEFMLDKFLRHLPRMCKELDDFYATLDSEQQKREKILHIKHCKHRVHIRKKLL